MKQLPPSPTRALIVAVAETSGSALYGMVDVLSSAGVVWQALAASGASEGSSAVFDVRIVSVDDKPFACANNIPVAPALSIRDGSVADIVILPELWLRADESIAGRYPELMQWIRDKHVEGASIYSACSGSIMLAETGLLDGRKATSHWGYKELFRTHYPQVRFEPDPTLVYADESARIATAGGTTSWHDLALHIIARYAGPAEALRIAKVYLMKLHPESQLPWTPLVLPHATADREVELCQEWLKTNYRECNAVAQAVGATRLAERTLKRRFKSATGITPIEYLQNVRVERAKELLENTVLPGDEVSAAVGYEDASFFRRLFKRCVGISPAQYRRMFRPVLDAGLTGTGASRRTSRRRS